MCRCYSVHWWPACTGLELLVGLTSFVSALLLVLPAGVLLSSPLLPVHHLFVAWVEWDKASLRCWSLLEWHVSTSSSHRTAVFPGSKLKTYKYLADAPMQPTITREVPFEDHILLSQIWYYFDWLQSIAILPNLIFDITICTMDNDRW